MNDAELGKKNAELYLDSCEEYTHSSEREHLIRDWMKKHEVADRIVGDFERRAGTVRGKTLLDLGCGNGTFMAAFARAGSDVTGLEVNPKLVEIAQATLDRDNLSGTATLYDGFTFPFADESFDYVFTVSTLEHVSDHHRVLSEIARVLKPGGRVYISFPNRWRPLETHTGVWFLSYFPKSLAERYMRARGRNTIEEINLSFLSFWSLKKFLRSVPLEILPELEATSGARRFVKRVLATFGIHFSAILGTVMVVAQKKA